MKIVTKGRYSCASRTIFLDVDDVVLNSSETMIALLNEKYGQNKRSEDLTDWYFRSLFPQVTPDEIEGIFDSDEFWNKVSLEKGFFSRLTGEKKSPALKAFNWIYVTKGNEENLKKKYEYLQKQTERAGIENFFGFYGLNLQEDKHTVHMAGGIQIDDNMENLLETDAELKILVTNGRSTNYNDPVAQMDNLYVVDNIDQAFEILDYLAEEDGTFFDDMSVDIPERTNGVISLQEFMENHEI